MSLLDAEAIDIHVHVTAPTPETPPESVEVPIVGGAVQRGRQVTIDEVAAYYRERKMAAVVFPVDAETTNGRAPIPNDHVMEGSLRHPDVIIPFASVDPWKGKVAQQEVERLIAGGIVKGFKFHPSTQAFYPNDHRFYPLWEAMAAAKMRVVFHTGQTLIGASLPGGGGIKLKYSNPMFLDDLAADFPDLTLLLAHPSVPWQDEAISVCTHKPNCYIDLSGWSPKYFPEALVRATNGPLKHKVLFGSDFPLLTPDRWLKDFPAAGFKEELTPMLMRENALTFLGLNTA